MMDMDVIKMHSRLPVLLAELSRYDKDKAIEYIKSFEYYIPEDNLPNLLKILKGSDKEWFYIYVLFS